MKGVCWSFMSMIWNQRTMATTRVMLETSWLQHQSLCKVSNNTVQSFAICILVIHIYVVEQTDFSRAGGFYFLKSVSFCHYVFISFTLCFWSIPNVWVFLNTGDPRVSVSGLCRGWGSHSVGYKEYRCVCGRTGNFLLPALSPCQRQSSVVARRHSFGEQYLQCNKCGWRPCPHSHPKEPFSQWFGYSPVQNRWPDVLCQAVSERYRMQWCLAAQKSKGLKCWVALD